MCELKKLAARPALQVGKVYFIIAKCKNGFFCRGIGIPHLAFEHAFDA